MKIVDLRRLSRQRPFLRWARRTEEGILVDGVPWIAKYPRTTRDLQGKNLPPYTSSPVSEHLGARIYASLGIPVHETMLGYRNGRSSARGKDFTFPGKRLFEFKDIKNALSDDDGDSIRLPRTARASSLATCSHDRDIRPPAQRARGARAFLGYVRGGRVHQEPRPEQR